jgi:hypothetical protein
VRSSVQGNAASDYIRIATESLLPERFCDQGNVRALFFFRQKIATKDWMNAKDIEIVRGHSPTKNLDGVARARKREGKSGFGSEAVKDSLSFTIMLKSRRRERDIDQIARLIASEYVDDARRFFEWQAAQKQIVYQTENRGIRTDGERQRNHSDDGEPWRFKQGPKRVFEVRYHKHSPYSLGK